MEPLRKCVEEPSWFAPYESIRADAYVLLASLLGQPPSKRLVDVLKEMRWVEPLPRRLDHALRALRRAVTDYSIRDLEDEYNRLFVGLGCGEMVPYASWYKEKTIQSSPLVPLRSDLVRLGIVRQADTSESEDHASALCECMALISQDSNEVPRAVQARFFGEHIAPWMSMFFEDLQLAKSARFYRTVGLLGCRFLESELEYLKGPATRGKEEFR